MSEERLPHRDRLARRWRLERMVRLAGPIFIAVSVFSLVLIGALLVVPGRTTIFLSAWALAVGWAAAGLALLVRFLRRPPTSTLAKRADHVLGLSDDLLSLSELRTERDPWTEAAQRQTEERITNADLKASWAIPFPRSTAAAFVAAVLLSGLTGWYAWQLHGRETVRLAQVEAARTQRAADAEEVLKDWEDFVELTNDPELKKLFASAGELREALTEQDPMEAMREMNRMEERMSALQDAIAKDSLASQAPAMAEALEAFEGMGAMSAALRNQNFPAAADEAEKLAAKLGRDPDSSSALRRASAVAEMLAAESKTAANRGNKNLSEALSQMSQAASQCKNPGAVPNSQIADPTKALRDQFAQESARKNRGRAVSLSKDQLEMLRRKLRGDKDCDSSMMPSLCQSCSGSNPGGQKAGTSPGGDPRGEETALAEAGLQESAAGISGDGESETRTTSSASGSGSAAGSARPTAFSDYAELSQQAVEDESLPLSHRRVIRTYFERIRPVAENSQP